MLYRSIIPIISIHALLAESDWVRSFLAPFFIISIHALLAESDTLPAYHGWATSISIHALLAESDNRTAPPQRLRANFYPRSPCGERLHAVVAVQLFGRISIHALLAESDVFSFAPRRGASISIHALLAESDVVVAVVFYRRPISIHALLAESDRFALHVCVAFTQFLSTLSLRRATSPACCSWPRSGHFYPRSPCGERRGVRQRCGYCSRDFYPRSPCGERPRRTSRCRLTLRFLSTLSLRRATSQKAAAFYVSRISIHALLAESDASALLAWLFPASFLSTLSLRRATVDGMIDRAAYDISIHALLAESDLCRPAFAPAARNFYPRSPCGERRNGGIYTAMALNFYPRSPCGERPRVYAWWAWANLFLSTLSLRRATSRPAEPGRSHNNFYPRSPCGERRQDSVSGPRLYCISIHALLAESDTTR